MACEKPKTLKQKKKDVETLTTKRASLAKRHKEICDDLECTSNKLIDAQNAVIEHLENPPVAVTAEKAEKAKPGRKKKSEEEE